MSRVAVDAATSLAGSTSVDLVVVHCREPLGWLTEVRAGLLETAPGASLRLFVYEKCGDTVPLPWSEATDGPLGRVQLPNRGEECLGYLTYLIARYHALPDYSVFFQGDGVLGGRASRTKACAFGARVARRETGVFRTVNDHQYISLAASKEACAADASLVNCNEGGPGQWRCLSELVVRHGIGVPAAGYATYANAQFGVSRDKITDRPLRFYQVKQQRKGRARREPRLPARRRADGSLLFLF